MIRLRRLAAALAAAFGLAGAAHAEQEFPPPQGKGPVVVVASGMSGPAHYEAVAKDIAKMGYDVVLFDGNAMEGTHGAGLKEAILKAQAAPHGLPGKVAVVGFSLGGGITFAYATHWPDLVNGVVVWYPATKFVDDPHRFVDHLQAPVLMFAGEADTFRGCCLIETARALGATASADGKPLELVTYPGTDHDFVRDGANYNPKSYADALARTQARLKVYFGQ